MIELTSTRTARNAETTGDISFSSISMIMWPEIMFDVAYLVIIWSLVLVMICNRSKVKLHNNNKRISQLFTISFGLLAFGDTFHLGCRFVAFGMYDLDATTSANDVSIVGLGALFTAITVTFFYVVLEIIWQLRFQKPYGWFGWFLFTMPVLRFILMIPAGNEWTKSSTPPYEWSIIRNVPLLIQGLGIALLILRDSIYHDKDRSYQWIAICIIISYACYIPILFAIQKNEMLGFLMVPKTIAYVAIGFIAYFRYFVEGCVCSSSHGGRTAAVAAIRDDNDDDNDDREEAVETISSKDGEDDANDDEDVESPGGKNDKSRNNEEDLRL